MVQNTTVNFYNYNPNVPGAAVFCGIFFLSAILHGFQIVKHRSWYFTAFFIGALMEAIGYIGRILSHNNTYAVGPYLLQILLLLLAPALFAATIYVVLGRIIVFVHGENLSPIHVDRLTKLFVLGDFISLNVQGLGGGFSEPSLVKIGRGIVLAGLIIQILWFGFFIFIAITFHRRVNKNPTDVSEALATSSRFFNWRVMLYVLYTASALIMIRSIFRVVEFSEGSDGYLMNSEVWLFEFDGVLMSNVVGLFIIFHPAHILPEKRVSENHELSDRNDRNDRHLLSSSS